MINNQANIIINNNLNEHEKKKMKISKIITWTLYKIKKIIIMLLFINYKFSRIFYKTFLFELIKSSNIFSAKILVIVLRSNLDINWLTFALWSEYSPWLNEFIFRYNSFLVQIHYITHDFLRFIQIWKSNK